MVGKAGFQKIKIFVLLLLACFSLLGCRNGNLSVSSSTQLVESEEPLQLAESQESLAQEDAEMEEDSFVSSGILDKYYGVEKKAEQTLAVFAREAREGGEEKQKFQKQIELEVGKEIEIQMHFKNLQETVAENVWLKAEIENAELEYIPGSTLLYNTNAKEGKTIEDSILGEGVNIGSYNVNGDAYLRFRCKIIAAGRKEYGGNIKVSGNVFDGMDYQADWASIYTKNSAIQINQTAK